MMHRHPVNVIHYEQASFGEKAADITAAFIGSWKFIILQGLFCFSWLVFNSLAFTHQIHVDPWPFFMLNLTFSFQAFFAAPVILLAQNRAAKRDRLTLEHTHENSQSLLSEIQHNTEITRNVLETVSRIPHHRKVRVPGWDFKDEFHKRRKK